jgi:TRAP-type mannitol/chloroaromatic compound transport system substrate-binding protein
MKRRNFIAGATAGALTPFVASASAAVVTPQVKWRLTSSYPPSLDTIYGGAEILAHRVAELTEDRFQIRVFGPGDLVPGLQVLDAVQAGTVECGHSAGYYYVGKHKAFAFDTSVPFGLTARQQNAWMYAGGGLELMRELFAEYNVLNFPGGNTGAQMGGWFRREVNTMADMKGLKMRIPGIGGEILGELGVLPQTLAGADIYPALERGAIDATEWIGPYDDEKLGFYKVAKHYYFPGFWEPGPQLSFYVNRDAWAQLPKSFQSAFEVACAEVNAKMLAAYDARNPVAMARLINRGVKLHRYPQEIMQKAQEVAFQFYSDESAKNPLFKKIYTHWSQFRRLEHGWHNLAETSLEAFMYSSVQK